MCATGGSKRLRAAARQPLDEVRHVDAALEEGRLPAAIGPVDVRQADVVSAAVVAREHDQRIVLEPVRLEGIEHLADAAVQGPHHGRVHPQSVVRNVRERVVIRLQRLQRRVHGVERQVHEERPVAIGHDRLRGLVGQVVGQVGGRREARAAVVLHCESQVGPEKPVDGVEVLVELTASALSRGRKSAAPWRNPRVSSKPRAAVASRASRRGATSPGTGVVTLLLQHLAQHDFAGRHRHGQHGRSRCLEFGVIDAGRPVRRHLVINLENATGAGVNSKPNRVA